MKQIVVVADMKIGKQGDVLLTHALGSCLGLIVHDPGAKIGGLLHAMLPLSKLDRQKADTNPYMFVDTGVPELFKRLYDLGGDKSRFEIKMVGCASPLGGNDMFKIGERNYLICKMLLNKNSIFIKGESVGGAFSRTVYFDIATGEVVITSCGKKSLL
jgi:chemotaxis protein CheD